jgi:Tetratricopeptide repeat
MDDLRKAVRLFTDLTLSGDTGDVVPAEIRTKIVATLRYATEPEIIAKVVLADLLWREACRMRDLALLGQGLSVLEELADELPKTHRARQLVLANMCTVLQARADATENTADRDRLIAIARGLVAARPPSDPRWTEHVFTLSDALRRRAVATGSLADLDESIEVTAAWSRAVDVNPGPALLALNVLLLLRYQRVSDPRDLDAAIEAGRKALTQLRASASAHPDTWLKALVNLAQSLQVRFGETYRAADLDEAVMLWAEAIPRVPAGHPDYAAFRSNFGTALLNRFKATKDASLLDEAIGMGRAAVAAETAAGQRRRAFLSALAESLEARFQETHDPADLDELVAIDREPITALPGHGQEYCGRLMALAARLDQRYDAGGRSGDLDEVIDLMREFVRKMPPDHFGFPAGMMLLCQSLRKRSDSAGDVADLDEAISNLTRHAEIQAGEPLAYTLLELGNALRTRAELRNDLGDLDDGIAVLRRAADSEHPTDDCLAGALNSLSLVSRLRFERTADPQSLKDAIRYGLEAVEISERIESTGRSAAAHSNLGAALSALYELNGKPADLDAAVNAFRTSLSLTPAGSLLWTTVQSNLGHMLRVGFDNSGQKGHLDDAICALREAALVPRDTTADRAITLTNLAGALMTRYRHYGAMTDLDESIRITRTAIKISPLGHRNLAMAHNGLCAGLYERFDASGDKSDLEEAIRSARAAIKCLPDDHPNLAMHKANLAAMLYQRHKLSGGRTDLANSISLMRASAEKASTRGSDYVAYLANLGLFLSQRFKLSGDVNDLESAVACERSASNALPDDHPVKAGVLANLGSMLLELYESSRDERTRDEALWALRRASEVAAAPPDKRLAAAWARGSAAAADGLTEEAATGLDAAVRLLPLAAWHGTALPDRERHLSAWQGLAREAAAWALSADGPDRAVDVLEMGRAVLWSQMLHVRGDLAELRDRKPQLADALDAIRTRLAVPPRAAGSVEVVPSSIELG